MSLLDILSSSESTRLGYLLLQLVAALILRSRR